MAKKPIELIDDYNGKFEKLTRAFPEVAKKILKGNSLDRFMGGINSVCKFRFNQKEYLFIETPQHEWILDMSGKIVGEGDGGFFLHNQKPNSDWRQAIVSGEQLF